MGPDHHRRQLIAALALTMLASPATADWRAELETYAMDGKFKALHLILDAKPNAPILRIRCEDREPAILFDAGAPLRDGMDSQIWLRIKYDAAAPFSLNARRSTNFQTVLLNAPQEQLAEILKGSRMLVEYTPFHAGPKLAEFNIRGLSRHLALIKQHCSL